MCSLSFDFAGRVEFGDDDRNAKRPPLALILARRVVGALLLFSLLAPGIGHSQIGELEDLAKFPSGKLEIRDGKKVSHVLQVWLADTPSARRRA